MKPIAFLRPPLVSLAACAGILAAACAPAAPDADEGTFVIRLGTDTVGVERYTLTADRLEALAVTRTPRTLLREMVLEFGEEGAILRYESRAVDPALPEEDPPIQRTVIRYEADSAAVETGAGEETETRRIAAGPDLVPFSLSHLSLAELAIRRALAAGRDTAYMLSGGPLPMALRRPAPDSVALETGPLGTWLARVDEEGRVLAMSTGALGRDVERVRGLDADALARRWAEADARGEGMGPLSPRDTVRATVGGAAILVDYSRPAKRGRVVFGNLVPYGQVWRTGADVATHLVTDRPLIIEGERLPAGTYTLFTIPEPDRWTLIVNRESGQPGTEHDEAEDLFRVPMQLLSLDPPEERFTIAVEEEAEGGVLRLRWDGTEARVSFRVETGGRGSR